MNPVDEPGKASAEGSDDTLGYSRAVDIACASANTDHRNLSRTLSELGVEGVSFQGTVFNAIRDAGYTIDYDSIPDAPTSTLLSVVGVIENATLA
jgi:hypothetical protein